MIEPSISLMVIVMKGTSRDNISRVKLLLFVFCLLFSFEAVSGLTISIYTGVEFSPEASIDKDGYPSDESHTRLEADKNFPEHFKDMEDGIYKYKKEADYYLPYSGYGEFRAFLIKLRLIRGYSSTAGKKLLIDHQQIQQRFPLHVQSSSGLSDLLLMPDIPLQHSFSSIGASNIVEHVPFDDLISFNDHNGSIGAEACRRLRKDFIDFFELAKASGCDEYLINTFEFFFKNLQNADIEDTVIDLG